jgi:hypothetical protein
MSIQENDPFQKATANTEPTPDLTTDTADIEDTDTAIDAAIDAALTPLSSLLLPLLTQHRINPVALTITQNLRAMCRRFKLARQEKGWSRKEAVKHWRRRLQGRHARARITVQTIKMLEQHPQHATIWQIVQLGLVYDLVPGITFTPVEAAVQLVRDRQQQEVEESAQRLHTLFQDVRAQFGQNSTGPDES